ncbi:MAG: cysteine desulfurase family protein [Lactobacillus sp.]
MTEVYLDNAATTPLSSGVIATMTHEMQADFGNASATYALGRQARNTIDVARSQVANLIHADAGELIFTSGGSESNNTVIFGVARSRQAVGRHIVTTAIEHPSVLEPMRQLEREGYQVTYLPVDQTGHISLTDLKAALTPDTILVSAMAVNNEVGSINPLREIGALVHANSQAYFHVDAVQGIGNLDLDVHAIEIDFLSSSAHKINGPKFLGFLYANSKLKLPRFVFGGEQEVKRRAGTENVPGIAGFATAVRELQMTDRATEQARFAEFQKIILTELDHAQVSYEINGGIGPAMSHHVLNLHICGVATYVLQTKLDLDGYAISGGSACTAGSITPSHVLTALFGADSPRVAESIRISFGRLTTSAEVTAFAKELAKVASAQQA